MQGIALKKHMLRISLILILLISAFLCIYSIGNYKANNIQSRNKIEQNNSFNISSQMPQNQNMDQHRVPSNGEVRQPPNGSMKAPGGNMPFQGGNMRNGVKSTGNKYAPLITAYSVVFLSLFIAAYYFFVKKKMKISDTNIKILMFTLLCIGLLLRISASTLMEGHNDINLFKNWATIAANNLSQFYTSSKSADYPPLYIYILFLIGKIANLPVMSSYYTLLLKLPAIIADIATAYFIYKLARKYLSLEVSILIAAFYIFNPAVFIDSTFWGQVDSFFTFLIVLSIFLLSENKIVFSSALFTAAVLMKPQGIIFLPVLFFELVRQRNLKNFVKVGVSALITAVAIILPFSFNQDILWIFKLFSKTISEYPYASVNAFNFFSLLGANYTKDTTTLFIFSYHSWGMIFIIITTAFSWFIYIKGNSRAFAPAVALLQIAGVFTFASGMHERYLFPAAALSILTFIYLKDKRFYILAIGFSITSYINIYAILFEAYRSMNAESFNPILMVISLLNVLLVVYLVKALFDIVIRKRIYNY